MIAIELTRDSLSVTVDELLFTLQSHVGRPSIARIPALVILSHVVILGRRIHVTSNPSVPHVPS